MRDKAGPGRPVGVLKRGKTGIECIETDFLRCEVLLPKREGDEMMKARKVQSVKIRANYYFFFILAVALLLAGCSQVHILRPANGATFHQRRGGSVRGSGDAFI